MKLLSLGPRAQSRFRFDSSRFFFVDYKDWQCGEYRPDFTFADDAVIVDLKAALQILPLHKAQVLSYLQVAQAELGLIMNFGGASIRTAANATLFC